MESQIRTGVLGANLIASFNEVLQIVTYRYSWSNIRNIV